MKSRIVSVRFTEGKLFGPPAQATKSTQAPNKTTVQLTDFWVTQLLDMPESGMGYHRVNITLKSGRVLQNVIVLNNGQCQHTELFAPSDVAEIKLV